MKDHLKIKTVRNLGYSVCSRIVIFGLSLITNIVLARNLESGDYGLIGFATIFITFLTQFSDFGIHAAVIQRENIDEKELYTAFTMRFILSFSALLISFFIAMVASNFFDHPAIKPVILILCLNLVIGGFGFIPSCLLTRELNYGRILLSKTGAALVNSALAITLALNGFKFWSIVAASIGSALTSAILLNILQPKRIRFYFDLKKAAGFFHFGGIVLLNELILFFLFNADNFLIGALAGATKLGYYAIAFTWGSMVSVILYELVHNILFPTFSRIQNDRRAIRNAYLKVLEYTALMGIVINLTLFVFSRDFLFFVLGRGTDKWIAALPTLKILCVYGAIRSLLEPVVNVIMADGKPQLFTRAVLIAGSLQLVLLYPALKIAGIEGVAALITVTYLLQYFVFFPYLKKIHEVAYRDLWSTLRPSVISGALILAFFFLLDHSSLSLPTFLMKVVAFATAYFLIYGLLTRWKIIAEMREMLQLMTISNDKFQ